MKQIRIFTLQALARMSGSPMPDSTLKQTLRLAFPSELRAEADAEAVIRAVEASDWIVGYTDDLVGLQWLITTKGDLKLRSAGLL